MARRTKHARPIMIAAVELCDEAAVAVAPTARMPREDPIVPFTVVRALSLRISQLSPTIQRTWVHVREAAAHLLDRVQRVVE